MVAVFRTTPLVELLESVTVCFLEMVCLYLPDEDAPFL